MNTSHRIFVSTWILFIALIPMRGKSELIASYPFDGDANSAGRIERIFHAGDGVRVYQFYCLGTPTRDAFSRRLHSSGRFGVGNNEELQLC